MGQELDRERSKRDRIERLRQRLNGAKTWPQIAGVIKGLLDLLEDEL